MEKGVFKSISLLYHPNMTDLNTYNISKLVRNYYITLFGRKSYSLMNAVG